MRKLLLLVTLALAFVLLSESQASGTYEPGGGHWIEPTLAASCGPGRHCVEWYEPDNLATHGMVCCVDAQAVERNDVKDCLTLLRAPRGLPTTGTE